MQHESSQPVKKSWNNLQIKKVVVSPRRQYPLSLLTMLKSAGRFFYIVMKTNYIKTCTSEQDLILLLKNRGLIISDEQKAINYLSNIGYFRLSAYLYPYSSDL